MKNNNLLKSVGPGLVVAATGVGAGDVITASVAGAKFGYLLIWAAIIGAVLKFVLNEGIGRYQLATGETVLQGWRTNLHPAFSIYFLIYLFFWTFIVAGALMSACGLAAHAMVPQIPVSVWGVIHSLVAFILVWFGKYSFFEKLIKWFIASMAIVVCASAIMVKPSLTHLASSIFVPHIPVGAGKYVLGVIGGVGGSVTLLSYGYWIKEKSWAGPQKIKNVRIDLTVAYALTGLFGIAIMIVSADVNPEVMSGSSMVLEVANRLGHLIGPVGKWIFIIGFWGAVFTSMLGVWQGIPYLFSDYYTSYKTKENFKVSTSSKSYRYYLLYIALPPMLLLFSTKPVWMVIFYTIAGAFFMPFIALTLPLFK
jgi:Mn2+/Fe2+ NRAMP family transporter